MTWPLLSLEYNKRGTAHHNDFWDKSVRKANVGCLQGPLPLTCKVSPFQAHCTKTSSRRWILITKDIIQRCWDWCATQYLFIAPLPCVLHTYMHARARYIGTSDIRHFNGGTRGIHETGPMRRKPRTRAGISASTRGSMRTAFRIYNNYALSRWWSCSTLLLDRVAGSRSVWCYIGVCRSFLLEAPAYLINRRCIEMTLAWGLVGVCLHEAIHEKCPRWRGRKKTPTA